MHCHPYFFWRSYPLQVYFYIDTDPWTPETNFAPWFLVSALVAIRLFAFSSAEPTGEIPDLHRMMQFNRYIHG